MTSPQTLSYKEIMTLLKRTGKTIPMHTGCLIAFQYASGGRMGELLPYTHNIIKKIKSPTTGQMIKRGRTKYKTMGLIKENFYKGENKIAWVMPNFKTRNPQRSTKNPFILKEETLLWEIANYWLKHHEEHNSRLGLKKNWGENQLFPYSRSYAHKIIKEQLRPYSSHILRRSRGTHLAEMGYNAYEIRDALGHIKLESGLSYVSTHSREQKLRDALIKMKQKEEDSKHGLLERQEA